MDWITNIWTKPLASWTLLDALNLAGYIAIPYVLWHIVAAIRETRRNTPSVEQRHAAKRRAMGYDKD